MAKQKNEMKEAAATATAPADEKKTSSMTDLLKRVITKAHTRTYESEREREPRAYAHAPSSKPKPKPKPKPLTKSAIKSRSGTHEARLP